MIEISLKCIGCTKCLKACPFGALSMDGKLAKADEKCTLCGACVQVCPVQAITITRREEAHDISGHKGVWVFVELQDAGAKKAVRAVAHELLSCGRGLADELGEELCAVLIGDGVSGLCDELASYGADKVYLVENPELRDYNTDTFATALVALITKHKPSMVLYPSTYVGRDLAPRIASELYVGLTADCTGLSIKNGNLLQTRPAFGGNIMADILSPNTRPQMATVRPNVMKKNAPVKGARAQIVRENIAVDKSLARVKVVEKHIAQAHGGLKIDEAQVVVSGGRGMRDSRGFKILEQLADALGGAVGASRAAVDMGLKPKPHQVGQSGTTVSPKLYVACGISGAVQHIVGMTSSDIIIAINRDPSAQIFNVAKYGLVGDAHQVLPKVIDSVKKK
ncbi:MAG TPA: electron transfer flavoprotein subunit alpha [Elusimicrobiales bacterium]|nr:electron transfer flavoprotein subunit alpha [Elusimicrobiales bacterium]